MTGIPEVLDPSMPWLAEALDSPLAGCRLRETGAMPADLTVTSARVTRHREGRRCLIEYELADSAANPGMTLVGKSRAKGLDRRTIANISILSSSGFGVDAPDGICVPPVAGIIEPWSMWLAVKLPGSSATELIAAGQGIEIAGRVAAAARKLHSASGVSLRAHSMENELELLDRYLHSASAARPHLRERIDRAMARCREIGEALEPARSACIHRDFYAEQVLIDADRLFILDLDELAEGDPRLDIGNFIAHITEQSLRTTGNSHALDHVRDAVVSAYSSSIRDHEGIMVYDLLSLARHIWISVRVVARNHLTEPVLAELEKRLDANG